MDESIEYLHSRFIMQITIWMIVGAGPDFCNEQPCNRDEEESSGRGAADESAGEERLEGDDRKED